jgi:hypothetical protein
VTRVATRTRMLAATSAPGLAGTVASPVAAAAVAAAAAAAQLGLTLRRRT